MYGPTHRLVTKKAVELLAEEWHDYSCKVGKRNLVRKQNDTIEITTDCDKMCSKNSETDNFRDLEFVNVEGCGSGTGRDDPHDDNEWDAIEDKNRHYITDFDANREITAFQHFIDLGHTGLFDDYDGYSYRYGSASKREYEPGLHKKIGNVIKGWLSSKATLDADINYYLNDEYVHAPGMKWYRNCSEAVWHYTFVDHQTKTDQILKRYPLAQYTGKKGCGIPYSVFTPLDNLGRFWYERFLMEGNPEVLGPALHAIQDACVPHHASGYLGNWHETYEKCLENEFDTYVNSCDSAALELYRLWSQNNDDPVDRITYPDSRNLTPSKSWRIDHLITWLACQAHYQYVHDYNNFNNNDWQKNNKFKSDQKAKPRKLLDLAVAMTMLVLDKAKNEYIEEIGENKVDSIDITIYAPTSKAKKIPLQLRLYYNYCGGCLETSFLAKDATKVAIDKKAYFKYHQKIDLSQRNVNSKRFRLELERCRIKNFDFYFKITYKTAGNKNHTYANTFETKVLTKDFNNHISCIPLPRADRSITKIWFDSIQSPRYNAQSTRYIALAIQSRGLDKRYIQISPEKKFGTLINLPFSVDIDHHTIGIAIMEEDGKNCDAWLPKWIEIKLYDESSTLVYHFSKKWPDHLWLTLKSKSKNLPEYTLIQNWVTYIFFRKFR